MNFSDSQKDELMRQIGDRFVAGSTPKWEFPKMGGTPIYYPK